MMDKMEPKEKEIFADKVLACLLFHTEIELTNKKSVAAKQKKTKPSGLTPEEKSLIKELAKRTEDLKNLLGDDPQFFK